MKKKNLVRAVTLGLAMGMFAGVAMPNGASAAGKPDPDPTRTETISFDNKDFVKIQFYEKGNRGEDNEPLRKLKRNELQAITNGMHYWYDVLGQPKNGTPHIKFYPLDNSNDNNAHAGSEVSSKSSNQSTRLATYFFGDAADYESPTATIAVENDESPAVPWYMERLPIIPTNGNSSDYSGTIVHEMFHALGVLANVIDGYNEDKDCYEGNNINKDGNVTAFNAPVKLLDRSNMSAYAKCLYDSYGNALSEAKTLTLITDASQGKKETGQFYILYPSDTNSSRYGGVYFAGSNVTTVLGTDTKLCYPDDSNIQLTGVGIPVNCIEKQQDGSYRVELSHFELQNSLQSHQNYRNWCVPMEVELAALQDIGYTIDRSHFYGKSIYSSASKQEITADVTHAAADSNWYIGLHVYGSNNKITQNADITAHGDNTLGEVIGIRIDGSENDITLKSGKTITVDGLYARGINFTYGKNHTLTVEGTVKASGDNNMALAFDFGDNSMSNDYFEYRGSYIRTEGTNSDGTLKNSTLLEALDGPLMKEVNINGTIDASKATAIYISKNALVKTININKGAKISGDIVDEWNNRASFVQLPDSEDGMTSLNLKSGIKYSGDVEVSANTLKVYDASNTNDQSTITVGTISGGGALNIDAALVLNKNVTINLNTVDDATVAIFPADKTSASMEKLEDAKDVINRVSTAKFKNGGTMYIPDGLLEGPVVRDANGTHVERGTNDNIAEAMSPSAGMARYDMNDIRKRMGDIRIDENNTGMWLRNENGAFSATGIDGNFHKWQLGADRKLSDKWHIGAAFSTTSAGASFATGYNRSKGNSGAIYGMYTGKNGNFADIIARYGVTDNELSFAPGGYLAQHGDLRQQGMSISGEIGKTIKLPDDFFIEPQAELTYTRMGGDSFSSNTVHYDLDDSSSFTGRLGVTCGYHAGRDTVYTRFSCLHEFSGDSTLKTTLENGRYSSTTFSGQDTWFEWAVGGQVKLSKASYVYADLERTFGAEVNEEYRLNLGFRYSF